MTDGATSPGKPQQNGWIAPFDGSPRDKYLNEDIFDSLVYARRKLALLRYDDTHVRPLSSLCSQTPTESRRAVELFNGSTPGTLATAETSACQSQGLPL